MMRRISKPQPKLFLSNHCIRRDDAHHELLTAAYWISLYCCHGLIFHWFCDLFDHGSRQEKRDLVDLVTENPTFCYCEFIYCKRKCFILYFSDVWHIDVMIQGLVIISSAASARGQFHMKLAFLKSWKFQMILKIQLLQLHVKYQIKELIIIFHMRGLYSDF